MMRMLKPTLIALLVILPITASVFGTIWFAKAIQRSGQVSAEAYAQWGVARMIIRFMDKHHGSWPQNWDDLRTVASERMGPWTMGELEERVNVDFTADPQMLAAANGAPGQLPFVVISLKNGNDSHYEGAEPNRLVWEHLQATLDEP